MSFGSRFCATAIMMYSTVHTGPNTRPDGFHAGLMRSAYHPLVETNMPVAVAQNVRASQAINAVSRDPIHAEHFRIRFFRYANMHNASLSEPISASAFL